VPKRRIIYVTTNEASELENAIARARGAPLARVVYRRWCSELGCYRLETLWRSELPVRNRPWHRDLRQLEGEVRRRLGEVIDLEWLEDIEDEDDRAFLVRLAVSRLVITICHAWGRELDAIEQTQLVEQVVHQIVG